MAHICTGDGKAWGHPQPPLPGPIATVMSQISHPLAARRPGDMPPGEEKRWGQTSKTKLRSQHESPRKGGRAKGRFRAQPRRSLPGEDAGGRE